MRIILDTETRATPDLKKVGAARYFADPSAEVLIVSWMVRGSGARPELWLKGEPSPLQLFRMLDDPEVEVATVNATFDMRALWWLAGNLDWPRVAMERFIDIASKAAAFNIPRSLEHMAPALKVPSTAQKDARGKALLRKFTRPQKVTKKRPQGGFVEPEEAFDEWLVFVDYAAQDVTAADACDRRLPDLTPPERMVELSTWRMNMRGFPIDVPLVRTAVRMVDEHAEELGARFEEITGLKPKSAKKIAEWLQGEGVAATNVQRVTVDDLLKEPDALPPHVREALEIRSDLGAAGASKFPVMLAHEVGGRLYDEFLFLGAQQSGRWSSRGGVQLQNLARSRLKEWQSDLMIELLAAGRIDLARQMFAKPVDDLVSALRGFLIGGLNGLCLADFSGIEFKVLLWFAGTRVPEDDTYITLAEQVFRRRVVKGMPERQVGKVGILSSGYGAGASTMQGMVKVQAGVDVSLAIAGALVTGYRERFPSVPKLWRQLERAFVTVAADGNDTNVVKVAGDRAKFVRLPDTPLGTTVGLRLPSGHLLRWNGVELHPQPDRGLPMIVFQQVKNGQLVRSKTWGGTLCAQLVSGTSRDLLARAFVMADGAGLPLIGTVHDELVVDDARAYGELARIMENIPSWARGAEIKVEGGGAHRYADAK